MTNVNSSGLVNQNLKEKNWKRSTITGRSEGGDEGIIRRKEVKEDKKKRNRECNKKRRGRREKGKGRYLKKKKKNGKKK